MANLRQALDLFSKTKQHIGELTRKRIEQISNKEFCNKALIETGDKVSVYRGRAGTGKTVGLIQTAIRLVEDNQSRVIMLTYNKALVSDIRRLFAFAELPDMFEISCVFVSTLHAYFFKLVNKILYDGKMVSGKFLDNYNKIMSDLNDFLMDEDAVYLAKEIIGMDYQLNWEYVLIDEAQDWSNSEKDIILKLFEKGKIIVADGGLQFVRNITPCNWSMMRERNNIKLKYCLRQKENLITFMNAFTKEWEILSGKILSSNNMLGGRVVVLTNPDILEVHKEEYDRLKNAGNIAYDMLYLVPHEMVNSNYGSASFKKKELFIENGISVWDGTSNFERDTYSVNSEEVRVLQYDSSRGIEGWTVLCLDFDVFIKEKICEYVEEEVESLILESPEERKQRYIYNWMMIPFTRAIDTLVITLKDEDSKIGIILKKISDEYPDFITWE